METEMGKVVLITGASSGIGKATALEFAKKGFTVYGAARRVGEMTDLLAQGINTVELDVTNECSMIGCVNHIIEREGCIDVLVNNAGYGSYGAVEDVSIEEARRQFEVNIFGLARMVQLVLPSMRQNRLGRIVNISSIGGKVYTPYGAWYHATKFAVEGFSDCLRMELSSFGIDVIVIEPGCIKTPWGQIAADNLNETSAKGVYAANAIRVARKMAEMYGGSSLTKPEIVARTISKSVMARKPKIRYAVGYMAKPSLFFRWLLCDRAFDRLIKWM